MRYEVPIFRQLSFDVERSAREMQVFWAAVELLDLVEPRLLPLSALESQLLRQQREHRGREAAGVSRSTIAHALSKLEEGGYLVRSVGSDGRERFRIPLSRAPSVDLGAIEVAETRSRVRNRVPGVVSEAF